MSTVPGGSDYVLPLSKDEGPPVVEDVDPWTLDTALYLMQQAVRGNGLDPRKVLFTGFQGEVLKFEVFEHFVIEPQVADKLVHGKENGEVVGSIQEARDRIQQTIAKITQNTEVHRQTIEILKQRPDLGLGAEGLVINLDRQKKTFVVHEVCNACGGKTKTPCHVCQGRGKDKCTKCRGMKEMVCPSCHGRKLLGNNKACARCHGQGHVKCDKCRYTGLMPCSSCRAAGLIPCTGCSATGWHSHLFHLTVRAKSRFSYDRAGLPETVPALIDALRKELVSSGHVEAVINESKEREEALNKNSNPDEYIIAYDVRLPWGWIGFLLDQREIQGTLFGAVPSLVNMPPFLEDLSLTGLHALTEATQAKRHRQRAQKVIEAGRTRYIGEAFLAVGRHSRKRALEFMHERYPFGISGETLRNVVIQADVALKKITGGRRLMGLFAGLTLALFLYAGYYIGPLRSMILPQAGTRAVLALIDLLIMVAGGIVSLVTIRALAAGTLRRALGPLANSKAARRLTPKAGRYALINAAACLFLYLATVQYVLLNGGTVPEWHHALLRIAGLK